MTTEDVSYQRIHIGNIGTKDANGNQLQCLMINPKYFRQPLKLSEMPEGALGSSQPSTSFGGHVRKLDLD